MLDLVNIGRAIFHFRKRQAMSQVALGAAVGINQSNISRIERGTQDISVSMLEKIALVLAVQVSELCAFAETEDVEAVRWRKLYDDMTDDERSTALQLLEPRIQYHGKK